MHLIKYFLLLIVALAPAACSTLSSSVNQADTVYLNGAIYTVNKQQPWVEAVAIKNGKFMLVGSEENISSVVGSNTEVVDLQGRMAMPGMHDAHTHIELVGKQWNVWCFIPADATPELFISTLQDCAKQKAPGEWLTASVYGPGMFPDSQVDRRYLDQYFPDRPLYIIEHSWHHGMGNSRALGNSGYR